jgi:hypothetical protein
MPLLVAKVAQKPPQGIYGGSAEVRYAQDLLSAPSTTKKRLKRMNFKAPDDRKTAVY